LQTSDELALEMLRFSPTWALVPLVWEMPADMPTLLVMRIVGQSPEYTAPERRHVYSRAPKLPEELSMGDPFEHGAGHGAGLGGTAATVFGDSDGEQGGPGEGDDDGGEGAGRAS